MVTERDLSQYRDILSKFIKYKRKETGLTQQELADKAGLGLRTVIRIEHKDALPDIETLIKICDAVDCYFYIDDKASRDNVVDVLNLRMNFRNE